MWILNGDGIFDTRHRSKKTFTTSFLRAGGLPGFRQANDAQGNASVSAPVGVRVEPPVVNSLVTFEPVAGTSTFTPDARGCPSGYAGKFLISTKLINRSHRSSRTSESELRALSQGNLLMRENELLQERQFL
jgi:hypothetical protein